MKENKKEYLFMDLINKVQLINVLLSVDKNTDTLEQLERELETSKKIVRKIKKSYANVL